LSTLFQELRRVKPAGWSVVAGDRELVLRPKDRSVGKFGITLLKVDSMAQWTVGFFSRKQNHWTERATFPLSNASADAIQRWAEQTIAAEKGNRGRES